MHTMFPFFFANFEHAFPYNISNKRPLRDVTHLSTYFGISIFTQSCSLFTYLASYLGLPVPLGESAVEKSPSVSVTGDPAGSMPADTHLFQVFTMSSSPPPFLLPSSGILLCGWVIRSAVGGRKALPHVTISSTIDRRRWFLTLQR